MATTVSTSPRLATAGAAGRAAAVARAERRLYDAETALHAARQSGVDAWVAAAYDRLHEAILELATVSATVSASVSADHVA